MLFISPSFAAEAPSTAVPEQNNAALVLSDPYEPWNRRVFVFNQTLDRYTLKPVAKTYNKIVPNVIHKGVSNFLVNLQQPWSSVNHLLQGHPVNALKTLAKFSLNTMTTLGFYDLAKQQGLMVTNEDFGQTLAVWGAKPGPYLMLPFLGPSSYREGVGLAVNQVGSLYTLVGEPEVRYTGWTLQMVDTRANVLTLEQVIQGDQYSLLRDFWWQSRLSAIYNGAPVSAPVPVDDSFGDDDWDGVEPMDSGSQPSKTSTDGAADDKAPAATQTTAYFDEHGESDVFGSSEGIFQ